MKLGADKLAILACGLMLGACATYETQSASNVSRDVAVDEESAAATGETTVAAADEDVDMDRIICKRSIPTGTRFARKECRSLREWREMREATQDVLREGGLRNLQTDVAGSN